MLLPLGVFVIDGVAQFEGVCVTVRVPDRVPESVAVPEGVPVGVEENETVPVVLPVFEGV